MQKKTDISEIERIKSHLPTYTRVLWFIPKNTLQSVSLDHSLISIAQKSDLNDIKRIVGSSFRDLFQATAKEYESDATIEDTHRQLQAAVSTDNVFFIENKEGEILGGIVFVEHVASDNRKLLFVGWVWINRSITKEARFNVKKCLVNILSSINDREIYGAIHLNNQRSMNLAKELNALAECIVF